MGERSGIEWIRGDDGSAGATWNPIIAIDRVTGRRGSFCVHKSEGCRFCWASKMNVFRGTGLEYIAQNLERHRFEFSTDPRSQRSIDWPLRKKKPLRIFPCSMTDLFAAWHTDEMIDLIFAVMALANWHTFIITTKEAARMHDYMLGLNGDRLLRVAFEHKLITPRREHIEAYAGIMRGDSWPVSNIWLGVSVEDQKTADERVSLGNYIVKSPESK